MKSLFVALLVWVGAATVGLDRARAQDWAIVAAYPDVAYGLDQASITVSGDQRAAWTIVVFRESQDFAGASFDYVVAREVTDCAQARNSRTNFLVYHLDHPAPLVSEEFEGEWESVAPGSVGYDMFQAVCGEGQSPSARLPTPDFARALRAVLAGGLDD